MSSAGWVLVVLLFISPFYEASDVKDESSRLPGRQRRNLLNLYDMLKAVTGHGGMHFLSYGNWCGLGGAGKPIDPIDECCENHDICYNVTERTSCRDYQAKAVYSITYNWRVADDETAVCDDEEDLCKMTTCLCDAVLTNCLKSNMEFYDPEKLKPYSVEEMERDLASLSKN